MDKKPFLLQKRPAPATPVGETPAAPSPNDDYRTPEQILQDALERASTLKAVMVIEIGNDNHMGWETSVSTYEFNWWLDKAKHKLQMRPEVYV